MALLLSCNYGMRYLEHKHIIERIPDKLAIFVAPQLPVEQCRYGAKFNRLALSQGGRRPNKRGRGA
jgi:hypothetical protein